MRTPYCFVCSLAIFAAAGCTGYSITAGPGKTVEPRLISAPRGEKDLIKVNSVLVMPADFSSAARQKPVTQKSVDKLLVQALEEELSIEVKSAGELPATPKNPVISGEYRTAGFELARKYSLDSFMTASINEYVERQGSDVGATVPASVSFSLRLFRVYDRKEVWTAEYHFTDRSLSENIFRLKDKFQNDQGVRFRSAEDLIREAFKAAAADLARTRQAQFMK